MTEFELDWYIEDGNGSRISQNISDQPEDWKPFRADLREYRNKYLMKMINLASQTQGNNVSREVLISELIQYKKTMIDEKTLDMVTMCSGGQVRPFYYYHVFDGVKMDFIEDDGEAHITDEDIETGFEMFSVLAYCPIETFQSYQFLNNLITTQTRRTIIKAIVNTIKSDKIKEHVNKRSFNRLFMVIDKKFDLFIGKILLAISSIDELETLINMKLPYLTRHSKVMEDCLEEENCHEIRKIILDLGKITQIAYTLNVLYLLFQTQ